MDFFDFSEKTLELEKKAMKLLEAKFRQTEEIANFNAQKVLSAFIKARVSEAHLKGSSGYGYDDTGRDAADEVYKYAFGAEDALVRHNFVSGTHTLSVALFGVLRPGDRMLVVTGTPYDTLHGVIGISGKKGAGSLIDFGVQYDEVALKEDGSVDLENVAKKAPGAKMVYIQRSRGYALRPALSIDEIEKVVKTVKAIDENIIVMVDNCYGEFCETREPTEVGADLIAGSLIKNPGGAIAETGGYIAGRKDLVELCANRLTCAGLGKELGCTLGQTKRILQGFFFSPTVTAAAIKTADLASCMFSLAGYEVFPKYDAKRSDIVTSINLKSPEKLIAFCKGIQGSSAVDSYVSPVPAYMPGYDDDVIMAAGAFNLGSSIELSADGPMREPYTCFMQGGVTFESGRVGILSAYELVEGINE